MEEERRIFFEIKKGPMLLMNRHLHMGAITIDRYLSEVVRIYEWKIHRECRGESVVSFGNGSPLFRYRFQGIDDLGARTGRFYAMLTLRKLKEINKVRDMGAFQIRNDLLEHAIYFADWVFREWRNNHNHVAGLLITQRKFNVLQSTDFHHYLCD